MCLLHAPVQPVHRPKVLMPSVPDEDDRHDHFHLRVDRLFHVLDCVLRRVLIDHRRKVGFPVPEPLLMTMLLVSVVASWGRTK